MAKQNRKKKSTPASKSTKCWPWLISGFVGGYILASYLAHMSMLPDFFERKKPSPHTAKQTQKQTEKKVPQFDFYNMLQSNGKEVLQKPAIKKSTSSPKNQSTAAPVVKKSQPPKKTPDTKYFLQAAAFRSTKDADQLKAQLILAGYSVQVKKVTKGKTDWHRVLVGPFKNKSRAERMQDKLATQHIKSHVIISG